MIFSLDVRRARKGDCLLLHYGSAQDPRLVMIDGGPRGVYGPHLKPRIEEIRKARGLDVSEPLPVDLLMVSHVDDDHIQGILDLTKELLEAKRDRKPQCVQVLSLWHNSFDEIIDHKPDELTASVKHQFGPASVTGSGELPDDEKAEVEEYFAGSTPGVPAEEESKLVSSTLKVLASIEQGFQLRADAEALEFERNPEFGGKLIIAAAGEAPLDMGQGLTVSIAGPMKGEVEALRKKHNQWLKKLKMEGKAPPQALAAYVDKSVPNLSSLVLLAEAKGKTMLLTGDARGDKILQGLELVGLMKKGGKIRVGLLKVPHHGSANNLNNDFFERIIAEHYVFSGNGEHGNPERKALEMLFKARGDENYKIHLTYPVDEIDALRKEDWKKEQSKEKNKKKKDPDKKVRPNWSPAKHSLRSFFNAHEGLENKVKIADAAKPHLINLLDRVTF
ncbi:MAG: hypothetical protein L0Y57_04975 [Beijerinckiaceae bacterium]|nr:hypothetical protein [Beijerinckiaceae bacterium]